MQQVLNTYRSRKDERQSREHQNLNSERNNRYIFRSASNVSFSLLPERKYFKWQIVSSCLREITLERIFQELSPLKLNFRDFFYAVTFSSFSRVLSAQMSHTHTFTNYINKFISI